MWVIDPLSNELVEQQDQAANGGVGAPAPTTGAATNVGAAQASGGAPTGTNFTNFSKYLDLNKNKTEGLGNKVAGGVGAKVDEAGNALTTGENEFNAQISGAGPQVAEDEYNKLVNPMDLVDYVKDPTKVEQFKHDASGTYGGPNEFSDINNYQDLFDKLGGATKTTEQFKTSGGKQELIKDVYTRPDRAKAGMLGLDEALMNQTPTAYDPVKTQIDRAGELQERFDKISGDATTKIGETKQAVADRANDIQNRFLGEGGMYSNLTSGIDQRVADTSANVQKYADQAKNYLDPLWVQNNGGVRAVRENVPQEVLNQLGVTKDQYGKMWDAYYNSNQFLGHRDDAGGYAFNPAANVYGVNPGSGVIDPEWLAIKQAPNASEYLNFGSPVTANINRNTVANADEYAQLAALEALFSDSVNENFINAPDQAGKYNSDITNFNYQQLMDFLQNPRRLGAVVTNQTNSPFE